MKKLHYIVPVLLLLFSACGLNKKIPKIETFDDLSYPFEVSKAELGDGIEIAYFDEGEGKNTILLIHGLGSYAPAWKKNIPALATNTRVIAIDLPGYGKSSKGNYEGNMSFYATIVSKFIDKLQLNQVILGGHSMGGQIAMTTALAYPGKVKGLILVAPAGFETFSKGQKQWFREVLTPDAVKLTTAETVAENLASNFYKMPDDAAFMINDRLAMRNAKDFDAYCFIIPQNVAGMVDEPVFEYLPLIKAKTLIIFGRQDNLIPNRYLNGGTTEGIGKAGLAQLTDAKLHMVGKAGHFVQFEQSEMVNQIITDWLSGM